VNQPSLRADGATRGDLTEATALVVGGGALLAMPLLALIDQLDTVWLLLSLAGGLAGAAITGLGVRWFRRQGPPLESGLAAADPSFIARPLMDLPVSLLLVEASQRFRAHCVRFVALGSGALLVVFPLGALRWPVVALLVTSFIADQVLLRPKRYLLHEDRLTRSSWLMPHELRLDAVKAVYWRHYPPGHKPPFPSGERLIFELSEGRDLEFVFRGAAASDQAARIARALLPQLDSRLRILTPRRERAEVTATNVSEQLPNT